MGESMHNNAVYYVAVNQDVRESKKTLIWAVKHLHAKKICLLHVHIPISFSSSPSWLDENEMEAIQDSEMKTAYDSLYKYRDICINNGVNEEDVDISMTSECGLDRVGEGIVDLIYRNDIKKLVMGAAADSNYSRGMSITSRKAEYVSQHAPRSCQMWFICKGKLIETKEGSLDLYYTSESFSEFSGSAQNPSKEEGIYEHEKEKPNEYIVEPEERPRRVRPRSNGNKPYSSPRPVVSEEPPKEYLCPISMEIMRDPLMAADGYTYEAKNIKRWLSGGKQTSPFTNARLSHTFLIPNHNLRILINDWLHQHPNYLVD